MRTTIAVEIKLRSDALTDPHLTMMQVVSYCIAFRIILIYLSSLIAIVKLSDGCHLPAR